MEEWVQKLSEEMDRTAEQVKLKEKIRSEWSSIMKSDPDLTTIIKKITEGKATYEEVEELSYRVGKDLGKSLLENLEQTIPAGAKVPDDIYEVILGPVLQEGHGAVIEAAKKVQEEMNKRAGIGLKAQTADFDEDRAKGLAEKLKSGIFEDTKWVLDEPVALFHQSSADRTLKKNVKFQARAGLHPKIMRKSTGGCCKWCQALAGTFDYGDEPNDIYRRHQRCQCIVDFKPGDGKRQNVWSKEWHEDANPEKVEERKKTEKERKKTLENARKAIKSVDGSSRKHHAVSGFLTEGAYKEALIMWGREKEIPGLTGEEKKHVVEEFDNWLPRILEDPIVIKDIGNYRYTAICKGHNQYKIIDKKRVGGYDDIIDEVLSEVIGDDWRKYDQ